MASLWHGIVHHLSGPLDLACTQNPVHWTSGLAVPSSDSRPIWKPVASLPSPHTSAFDSHLLPTVPTGQLQRLLGPCFKTGSGWHWWSKPTGCSTLDSHWGASSRVRPWTQESHAVSTQPPDSRAPGWSLSDQCVRRQLGFCSRCSGLGRRPRGSWPCPDEGLCCVSSSRGSPLALVVLSPWIHALREAICHTSSTCLHQMKPQTLSSRVSPCDCCGHCLQREDSSASQPRAGLRPLGWREPTTRQRGRKGLGFWLCRSEPQGTQSPLG